MKNKTFGNFAILTLYKNQIEALANDAGVEFIEKPKRLFFAVKMERKKMTGKPGDDRLLVSIQCRMNLFCREIHCLEREF